MYVKDGKKMEVDIVCLSVSLQYTLNISNESVSFLDLKLTIQEDKIATSIYFKETASHNYLQYDSSHPSACKRSIHYSQFLRAKRICNQD